MPTLQIKTNVAVPSDQQTAILQDFSKGFAKLIGKAEKWVMIVLQGSVPMLANGSTDPAACCTVESIGNLGESENKQITQGICSLLNTHFKIPADRVYVIFSDKKASEWGWNNSTVG